MGRNKGFFRWKRGIAKRTFSLVLVFAMIAAMLQTMPGLQTVWAAEENVLSVMGPAGGDESVVVDDTEAVPETEGEPVALEDIPVVAVEGNTVTFTVTDANAAEIKIAGSFTNWGDGAVAMTKNGDTFTYTTTLDDGQYSFKFIRDGAWDPDPDQTFTVGTVQKTVEVNGTTVTFTVEDAGKTKITVPGSFNDWNPDAEGYEMTKEGDVFTLTVELAPGKYEYKFHRDGNWDSTPNQVFWVEGIGAPTGLKVVRGGDALELPATLPQYTDGENDPTQVTVDSYAMDPVEGITFDSANKTLTAAGTCADEEVTVTATVGAEEIPVKIAVIDIPITLKLHYDRSAKDNKYDGWGVHTWGTDAQGVDSFTKVGDEMIATFLIDGRKYSTFNYIIRKGDWVEKDVDADQFIDLSTIISGTVDFYVTAGVAGGRIELGEDVVEGVKIVAAEYMEGEVTVTIGMNTADVEESPEDMFTIEDEDGNSVAITGATAEGKQYILAIGSDLSGMDGKKYYLIYDGFEYEITIPSVYSTEKFESQYTYTGNDLGATWTQAQTTFKVWAPTASALNVKLYESGTKGTDDLKDTVPMTKGDKGVWTATVAGDLNGTYYTYEVTAGKTTAETCDPYARTTGVNGDRAMVIDLDSTDPEGWDSDVSPHKGLTYNDSVIYELHVRDFSIDESSGISDEHKGKFLGLTEKGTTNATGQATGLDYLEDLGVTHIHLLPFYDYGSVDETRLDEPQFNWGYDPKNYNVPEGSYSTDPYNGAVRVAETKQMIKALHDSNINVIMDVVYNHVQDANTFSFNQLVPGYFSRPDSNGSGCGNDTASERSMVKKFIVDSVNYWADEYHIDGFRFDLVGLLDTETINEIVSTVHEKHPDVVFYGEGWTMDTKVTKEGYTMATQVNSTKTPDFAYFSDTIRDMIKGSVFDAEGTGYVSGAQGQENSLIACFTANTNWSSNPSQTINYASCHDNYTLMDKLTLSATDATEEELIRMNNLAAAIYMTAEGIPLIHAGEEILRTKPYEDEEGNIKLEHNSYNKPDSVNSIKWATLNEEKYQNTRAYYKGLIAFRKAHAALRLTSSAQISASISADIVAPNVVLFMIDGEKIAAETADKIVVIFNANKAEQDVNLADYGLTGALNIYVNDSKAGTEVLGTVADGHAKVAPISAMVLVQESDAAAGTITSENKVGDGAPQTTIASSGKELQNAVLTADEFQRVENGEDAKISLEIEKKTATAAEESLVASKLGKNKVGMYLDISLYTQIGSDAVRRVTETNGEISISIAIPKELLNSDSSVTRTYRIIRIHDNAAELLEGSFDAKTGYFTFKTDAFSTYVLVYEDVPVSSGDTTITGKPQYDGWAGVSAEQKAKLMQASLAQNAAVTAPKTNDNAPIAIVIMLLMAGAVAVAGAVSKKRKFC